MGVGILVRRGAGIDQQLQGQCKPGIACLDRTGCRQRTAGAVATDSHAAAIRPQARRMGRQPLQRIPGIVMCNGELKLRRQAVVQRHNHTTRQVCKLAAKLVMRGHAAYRKAATMQIQQRRQARSGGLIAGHRSIEAGRQIRSVACGNLQVLHTGQGLLGDFKHAGAGFISRLGSFRTELVHGSARGPLHATQHIAHGWCQTGWQSRRGIGHDHDD